MPFASLRTAIETKLQGITALKAVYDVHTPAIKGYPAATFEPSGHENIFYTNTDNLRSYAFDIWIHQEMKFAGRDNAVRILSDIVDAVVTAFDTDYNLGGACDFLVALPSSWGEYVGDQGAVKFATLTLVCKSEIQVGT